MNSFGETWRQQDASFWDWMWSKHEGSAMTERILEHAMEADSVIEIGCGCGHMVGEMIKRNWVGFYLGFDISEIAVATTIERLGQLRPQPSDDEHRMQRASAPGQPVRHPRWTVLQRDFLVTPPTEIPPAEVVFARGVLQHQAHWAPMVVAAMQRSPKVVMGIGYTTDGPRHMGGWKKAGHYDVHVSLPLLRYEAQAMGIDVEIEVMPNKRRSEYQEALAVFTRASRDDFIDEIAASTVGWA